MSASAKFYRFLIDELRASAALETIRQQTVLEEPVAGLATLLLGQALLELLKSERVLTRGEMLDIWNLRQQEDEIGSRVAQEETARELREQLEGQTSSATGELQIACSARTRRAAALEQRRRMGEEFGDSVSRHRIASRPGAARVKGSTSDARRPSAGAPRGGGHTSSAGAQIEPAIGSPATRS